MNTDYNLVIIGGGPAGCAAAVYAARKKIRSALITPEWGGQSVVSPDVQNWIGEPHVSGVEIAQKLQAHVSEYAGDVLDSMSHTTVSSVTQEQGVFFVTLNSKKTVTARSILVCSGARRRELDIEGAKELNHRGISYCASCDAPLFSGLDVVVVGGGNAGFESALQLREHANKVYLFERGNSFRADPVTVDKVVQDSTITALTGISLKKIVGSTKVTGVVYSKDNGEDSEMSVGGVFVEIGSLPNSDFLPDTVHMNDRREVVVDPKTQRTSVEGIWAAGDVSDGLFRQNNISMGDAVKALEDIYMWLQRQ